jgi:ferredoxin-NADP reductase
MFVAGGIGITPVLSMMRQATEHGLPWVLYYGGRTIESMAFTREIRQLSQTAGAPVHLYPQDRSGLLPLSDIVAAVGAGGAVYACGPPVMLSALRAASRDRPEVPVHFELFSAPEAPADGPAGGPRDHERDFTVVLARTGDTVTVTNGVTILEAVREVRPEVPYSCEEGYCGTCEAKVLEGVPVHRDTVLTDDERAESASLMICVGSCGSKELVLDL